MPLTSVILLLIPLTYVSATLLPNRILVAPAHRATPPAIVAGIALLLTLIAAVQLFVTGAASTVIAVNGMRIAIGPVALSVRLDALTVVMLLLVNAIGMIILRFSRRYLDGEATQSRYFRAFLATLAAVSFLVVSNNLGMLALSWTASSITLHQLLQFYGDRSQAVIAAHKKFLMARVADVGIFGAVVLLWSATGTLEIDTLVQRAAEWQVVPVPVQLAGVLLSAGVIVRSAQLPFHGWLIQVMEAPTPVSALLHAGIVNIGGFVMIRLGGLMGHLGVAQMLLVVVGTTTAVLAGLVMTTRVSVKVSLAWSTCAQMGFMLLECGLGAYSLALLHLVAHSLYKAHAFLSSGRTVEFQVRRSATVREKLSGRSWLLGAGAGLLLMAAASAAFSVRLSGEPTLIALGLILTLAMAPVLARAIAAHDRSTIRLLGAVVAIVGSYTVAHWASALVVTSVRGAATVELVTIAFVAVAFLALFVLQAIILAMPTGRIARALYPACFAGFYLDELFTRLTFRIWPPTPALPRPTPSRHREPVLNQTTA